MQPLNVLTKTLLARTGTGALETIPHGQQGTPALVQLQVRDSSKAYTIGTHTSTAVLVTVALNAVYDLVIWWNK